MSIVLLAVLMDLTVPIHAVTSTSLYEQQPEQVMRIAEDAVITAHTPDHRLSITNITNEPIGVIVEGSTTRSIIWCVPVLKPHETRVTQRLLHPRTRATVLLFFYRPGAAHHIQRIAPPESSDLREWIDHRLVRMSYETDILLGDLSAE